MPAPQDSRRRPTAILLDVDGTLVDSNRVHARAWVDAFAEAGVAVDFEQTRRSIGMGGDKLMPAVSGISEDSEQGARIAERRREIFASRYLPRLMAFPQVRALVERLRADGHTVVVASSATKEELHKLLEVAGVDDLIQASTSSDDAEESKPDPDIVAAALSRAGVPPGDAVMLGDTPYDIEAARRAGIRTVGVECGGWTREELRGAVEVYESPADLLTRYDGSLMARIGLEPAAHDDRTLPFVALSLVAIGTWLVAREMLHARRMPAVVDVPAGEPGHPGLGPRERAELRELIARTS